MLSVVEEETISTENEESDALPLTISSDIGPLLQKYCIDAQLYLQHNITLLQLAKAIGTNRTYLSQYFSCQGTTYNTYINDLRVNHFINCYKETIAAGQPVGAQQLALQSGFSSYRTFSDAFKRKMGQSVTVWIKEGKAQR